MIEQRYLAVRAVLDNAAKITDFATRFVSTAGPYITGSRAKHPTRV